MSHMLQASVSNVSFVFSDVCCKCFYLDVAYVSHICCKFFYLDVAYVLQCLFKCFQMFWQVFQTHVSSISSVFRHMLQMFHLNVSKVNWVLYMLQCDSPVTATCYSCWGVVHVCRKQRRDGARCNYGCGKHGSGAGGPA